MPVYAGEGSADPDVVIIAPEVVNNLGVASQRSAVGRMERRIDTVGQIDYDADKLKAELNRRLQLPGLANVWVMPIKIRIDMLATGIKTPSVSRSWGRTSENGLIQKAGGRRRHD